MAYVDCGLRRSCLLARIGLSPPGKIHPLRRPSAAESKCSLPGDEHQARKLLVDQRTASPGYRPPETKLRNRLLSRRRKRECNEDDWTFSAHEVATALNSLLQPDQLGSAGLVEAVLLHADSNSLDEAWKLLHSRKSSLLVRRKRPQAAMLHQLPWLNAAAECNAVNHVRMMCQSVVSTKAIDKALGIALSKHYMATIEILLSFGADANAFITTIRQYLRQNDLALTRLLLSAPSKLIAEAWHYCLEPHPGMDPAHLVLVLAHRSDVVSEQILQTAIKAQDLAAATVLLAYTRRRDLATYDYSSICLQVCGISDIDLKTAFFDLLNEAGCVVDCGYTRGELVKAVKLHHLPLIRNLVKAGVLLDDEAHNVLACVAKNPDPDVFECIKLGTLARCKSASLAFCLLPETTGELTLLRAVDSLTVLSQGGLPKDELTSRLNQACENGQILAADKLLSLGADPSEESILLAIREGDLRILKLLCSAGPSSQSLTRAFSVAYSVRDAAGLSSTKAILELLLTSGASGPAVDDALRSAVLENAGLDIVRLLVHGGADANYRDGDCVAFASIGRRHELLQVLCSGCTLTPTSAMRALLIAMSPNHYDRASVGIIMDFTNHVSLQQICDVLWNSDPFIQLLQGHHSASQMVFDFLQHDLKICMTNDELLVMAVQMEDTVLATALLLTPRSVANLCSAFCATLRVTKRSLRMKYIQMLLEAARPAEIGQSGAIASETNMAMNDNNYEIIALLLEHNASVDFEDGEALREAAIRGIGPALSMFLDAEPNLASLKRACIAAAGSCRLSDTQKRETCECLLRACNGLLALHSSQLLQDAVLKAPRNMVLPCLLLERGVEVVEAALEIALAKASTRLLGAILEHCEASVVVALSRKLHLPFCRRGAVYQMILNKPDHGVPKVYLSHTLLDAVSAEEIHDLTIAKLLLRYGADAGYSKAEPFRKAIESESLVAVKLLSQHITTTITGDYALSHLARATLKNGIIRNDMFKCLLKRRVTKKACSSALRLLFAKKSQLDNNIVRQLLAKGAEPSLDMFVRAARSNDTGLFADLCLGLATSNKAVEGLLGYGGCTQEATTNADTISCCISPDVGAEPCTLLIWALLARPKITTNAIMVMLGQRPRVGRIDYVTPKTNVSAAFACLLDVTRLRILRALLATNKDAVADQMVSSETMARFVVHIDDPTVVTIDLGPQPLHMAAFYLGNYEAFRLLAHRIPSSIASNEGLLHLAAFLALPKFVGYLIHSHDANECIEDYANYIPLAVAIVATTASVWGLVANEEADFTTRRKQTIEILAPRTNLEWRDRGKTVVHFALHQGLDTTKILLNALDVKCKEDACYERFLYTDKEGKVYTPGEYVKEFLTSISDEEREQLISCLAEAGMGGP